MAGHIVTAAVLRHAPSGHGATIAERERARSPRWYLHLLRMQQPALQREDEIQLWHRLAEFLAANPQRSGPRKQHVLGDLWSGNFMRTVRLASRTCLQRRTAANWIALLHERCCADIPPSVSGFRNGFAAGRPGPALITDSAATYAQKCFGDF